MRAQLVGPAPDAVEEKVASSSSVQNEESEALSPEQSSCLREFDLTAAFGPCVGISREDRWLRAKRLGRDPPTPVWKILQSIGGEHNASVLSAYL